MPAMPTKTLRLQAVNTFSSSHVSFQGQTAGGLSLPPGVCPSIVAEISAHDHRIPLEPIVGPHCSPSCTSCSTRPDRQSPRLHASLFPSRPRTEERCEPRTFSSLEKGDWLLSASVQLSRMNRPDSEHAHSCSLVQVPSGSCQTALRLRSQLIRPTPVVPSSRAPGAGTRLMTIPLASVAMLSTVQ